MMDKPKYALRLGMNESGKLATDMARSLREEVERIVLDERPITSVYMSNGNFKVDRYRPMTRGVQSFENWNCHCVTEIQAVTFSLEPVVPGGLPNPPHCVVVWDQLEV